MDKKSIKDLEFKPINKRRYFNDVLLQLQSMIINKNLKQGDKLPPERELARMLNISRTSVREAIRLLEFLRIVEIRQGSGIYVRSDLEKVASIEFMGLWSYLGGRHNEKTVRDILEFRRCLDMFIIGISARNAKEDNIKEMQSAIDKMRNKLEKNPSGDSGDMEFHVAIAKATGNNVLTQLNYVLHLIWGNLREEVLTDKRYLEISLNQHKKIFQAIKDKDVKSAKEAMEEHINNAEKVFIEYVRKNKTDKQDL